MRILRRQFPESYMKQICDAFHPKIYIAAVKLFLQYDTYGEKAYDLWDPVHAGMSFYK